MAEERRREKEKGWKGGRVEGGEGRIHVKSTSKLYYQTCQYTKTGTLLIITGK